MRSADRSALAEVTAFLRSRGFAAHSPSRRAGQSRPGYRATYLGDEAWPLRGTVPGVYLFGDACAPGDFARICAALAEGGWRVEDCTPARGSRYVELGVARVLRPAGP